jgi:heme exporter protein A
MEAPATQAESVVQLIKLTKSIDERLVLRQIDLEIESGAYIALLGANGAGKSTLLKIIATLIPLTSGEVNLFGLPLTGNGVELRNRIGFISHASMLYRDLTAKENLEFYAKLYGLENPQARARQMLEMAGLWNRANDPVKSFSRGMVQRAAIARALLHDPQLVLADEPFSGLDAPSIESLEQLFADLNSAGKTIILVNHGIEQCLRLAERAVILRGGRVVVNEPVYRLYPREVLAEVSG